MEEFENKDFNEKEYDEVLENPENEETPENDAKKGNSLAAEIFDWIKSIAIALVVAFLLKNYVLTLAKVDGSSMEPSLQHADRLYVNRVAYTPERGDVIIFEPSSDPGRPYIKRVIAVGGDTVYIDFATGDVFVNDKLIDEPYISQPTQLVGSYVGRLIMANNYSRENPIKIEEGYFWAMGDNRNASKDSRELGPIPNEELMGHAVFRFWPLDSIGTVDFDEQK